MGEPNNRICDWAASDAQCCQLKVSALDQVRQKFHKQGQEEEGPVSAFGPTMSQ